ncbi:MAG: hypothetical protein KAG18_05790, partial [Sinobacterium sp.]|nr:hypothetical protein [Sinobacterium sp.]
MDLSILDWFIVIVGMLLLVVLLDGYRRAQRGRRNQVRLSKNAKRLSKQSTANEKKFTAELPNGGARSVPQGAKQAKEPVVASGLSAQDDFTVEPELSSQESSPQPAFDEPEPLCEADALDPLFVDPFKSSLPQEQTVPSPSANAEDTSEQREEF